VPTRLFHRHDAYFKRLLDQPGTALALLRERLPAVVARRLVDEEPESLPTSFISDDLEERRPDRLYLTRTREGQPVLVYTLVEHKSSPDHRTSFWVTMPRFCNGGTSGRGAMRMGVCGSCQHCSRSSSTMARRNGTFR
jgi:hypothetical protein